MSLSWITELDRREREFMHRIAGHGDCRAIGAENAASDPCGTECMRSSAPDTNDQQWVFLEHKQVPLTLTFSWAKFLGSVVAILLAAALSGVGLALIASLGR